MSLSAGTRLGPYEILAPLGAGGMGEVYRAKDTKLKRDVAIKVLPEALAKDADALSRFEREALAVAALSHQNILAIHDFGTHDGTSYTVMELLEGETLRTRLDAGPVPQKEAVDFALQIAKGLSAAHERGIVHRDLKPENLFVSKDGHLKILDFGLAKRTEPNTTDEATSAPTASRLTEPGTVMGTVGYMSPEQVRGLPTDHRSDIFSFGTILYEMLSGKNPFRRETPGDTTAAILRDEPADLAGPGKAIPAALDRSIRHCLRKAPEQRFQSARDIVFSLQDESFPPTATSGSRIVAEPAERKRRILVPILLGVAVLLAATGVYSLRSPRKGAAGPAGSRRVAVLPFENLGAAEDDYFADGMADEVRGKLTMLPDLKVIARSSSTPYRKSTKTPKEIAAELNVSYLLTGTVRSDKSSGATRVHLSPELVDVTRPDAPTSKWHQTFDAALTDVFRVQSDIAMRVAQTLGVVLSAGEEKRLGEKPTQNLAAYDAYLKGEETVRHGGSDLDFRRVLAFYEEAVALDPGFALAWARISLTCSTLYGSAPSPALAERAREAADKSLALAPDLPEGHLALGSYYSDIKNDPNRALEEHALGLRLAPSNVELLAATGWYEMALDRIEEAVGHLREAERLDPRSADAIAGLGDVLFKAGRYTEARETYERAQVLAPYGTGLLCTRARLCLAQGDLAGARALIRATPKDVSPVVLVSDVARNELAWLLDEKQIDLLLRLTPSAFDDNRAIWGVCLAKASALRGDAAKARLFAEEARKALEEQIRVDPEHADHVRLGKAYAYLGKKADAIREAELALQSPAADKGATNPASRQISGAVAQIYILVGEQEKALDMLVPGLEHDKVVTPAWLKIDPNFDPLRKNPRFQKLVGGAS
jgi:serine/threonine protein kinase/Tfp pilus assembly protein PilF